jgi:hypothetical protein
MTYIIPIFKQPLKNNNGTEMNQYWMFLERNGTSLIELESGVTAEEFAEMNEFPLMDSNAVVKAPKEDLVFLKIDSRNRDALKSFYSWNEVSPNTTPFKETWRMFLWVTTQGAEEDPWGVNAFLKEIELSTNHTAYSVLKTLRQNAIDM